MFQTATALFQALAEGFKTWTSSKETMSESTALKELKNKRKAIDYAEKIIFLVDKNEAFANNKDYLKLRKNFFKYN